jgi:alanine racemase
MNVSDAKSFMGPPPEIAGAVLTIRLDAIQENWRRLAARVAPAECGAAVKGDAYGLGVKPIANALWAAGCRSFFVARPLEGAELRSFLPREAIVYVLDGLFPGQAEFYAKEELRPALISQEEAREWVAFGRVYGRKLPCALHIDTGINRLGFSLPELERMLADNMTMEGLNIALVMSHLACADEPAHPLNERQRQLFGQVRARLPGIPASFANSSGIFLGREFIAELVRPGIALYGGNPQSSVANPMLPVAFLEGTVLQVRWVETGETVGYGATWTASRPSRVAVLGAGYKDGVPRALSSREHTGPAQAYLGGQRCPIIGRISMDMLAIDITDLPRDAVARGTRAELLGSNIGIDEAASWADTISYELLTRLGNRYTRLYSGFESEAPA